LGGGGGWGFAGEAVGVGLSGRGGEEVESEGENAEESEVGRRGAARALELQGCEDERDPTKEPRGE
jgi:hypothetical protein